MCQCMVCGCMWINYCGVCCGGVHEANLIYSYWCCKPIDLLQIDPQCCHICACDGLGYNCLWEGCICCAPQTVVEWSALRSAGGTSLASGKTIIINNVPASPVYMHPAPAYEMSANPNYGGGMNMNVKTNMGGPNMNMNANMGGVQMNTNMGMNGNVNMGMNGNANMGMGMNGNVNMNVNQGYNNNTPVNAKISF